MVLYLSISQDVLNNEIKNVAIFLRQKILKLHEVNLPNSGSHSLWSVSRCAR